MEQVWRQLNKEFYKGNPATYFRRRESLLVLAAARTSELDEMLEQGVSFQGIEIKVAAGSDAEYDRQLNQAFLVTESQVLLHHASEALIRLFLGHEGCPPCPWVECSALRDFRRFRSEVEQLTASSWSEERRQEVGRVFLGGVPQSPGPEWNDAVEAVILLLRVLSEQLKEDSNLYNAAKHGMAVVASEAYIGVSDESGRPVFGHHGPSVAFLESTSDGKERTWRETTKWCNIAQALWLADLAILQIEALWSVAAARYAGKPAQGVHIITKEAVQLAIAGELASGTPVRRFSRIIGVERL